jgi:hypothetical protein
MIESELEKGFEDLSASRVVAMLLNSGKQDARERGMGLFGSHETKWGSWRPYLIEDVALLTLCEDFRSLIRDHRMETATASPSQILADNKTIEAKASAKAGEVMDAVRGKGV